MDRVAFTIFGIDVMWYGVLIATGMLIGIALAIREAKRVGISEDDVLNIAIIAIPVAIICARLYYVIFSWDYYSQNPGEIFNIRGGGLAIHGGLIGGILTGFIYAKVKKLDFFKTADAVMVGMPLAQAIGRWGNFINGEAHGGPTSLPWGIMVDGVKVHPTFLYESIWDFGIFLFIMFYMRKKKTYEGEVIVSYITLYSIGRFFIEGLRTDSLMFGPIRMAQFVSLVGVVGGLILHFYLKNRAKKKAA
ncbi:prolipoprotein diacylglyceryl transferase [Peptacetobacter hiranonis]|uniref:Phosphatidylglycerol--prolipoprotein diacylglyceryl transferase n=1 Tax=Peptacetobacter hiranonis (strain DSM 13275 / JCM 10541 / KCTC 15199 / TO-931) TaxID=500633 RepID=B6FYU2_PEPHT|nr:prolipoprotein diacylglyceryl transferase [Peptacetobacter hiranonis]EEA85323.1 prolipoprotein diacylglyceryl transferase [Peptacetobacter hiranonis DSM 13275]QEK20342.1 Prolipoprotein diacylglyceryl transferase [Peptacetobacter hiranonis]